KNRYERKDKKQGRSEYNACEEVQQPPAEAVTQTMQWPEAEQKPRRVNAHHGDQAELGLEAAGERRDHDTLFVDPCQRGADATVSQVVIADGERGRVPQVAKLG